MLNAISKIECTFSYFQKNKKKLILAISLRGLYIERPQDACCADGWDRGIIAMEGMGFMDGMDGNRKCPLFFYIRVN